VVVVVAPWETGLVEVVDDDVVELLGLVGFVTPIGGFTAKLLPVTTTTSAACEAESVDPTSIVPAVVPATVLLLPEPGPDEPPPDEPPEAVSTIPGSNPSTDRPESDD